MKLSLTDHQDCSIH